MAATVTAKLALDSSGFTAGLTKAQAALGKLGAIGVPVMAAGFAAAAAAAAGLAVGIKKAVDIGGALSELSARTGVAAGELRVLQMAFERAGLSADKVGPAINKMQRAIIEAGQGSKTAQDALANLGLSVEQLSGLSPDKQFEAIGQAINGISNPAAQAAAAMQIFGRSGGEMLALFKDSGALGDAARAIGSQADLLTRNANLFDRASDILNTIGSKLEGFFVGVADQVVPAILPLLEAADGLDFAGIGQSLGEGIAFALTAITSGQIGNLLTAQLKLSGAEFANTMYKGIVGAMAFLVQRMVDAPSDFLKVLEIVKQPAFWQGMGNALIAAALAFGRAIMGTVADVMGVLSEVPRLKSMLEGPMSSVIGAMDSMGEEQLRRQNAAQEQLAGPLEQIRAQAAQSFNNAAEAASKAMAGASQIDTGAFAQQRDEITNSISEQMRANQEAARARFEASKTMIPAMDEEFGKAAKEASGVITDSMQKVGGGGNFARFGSGASAELNESKKQTGLLGKIAEGIGVAATASEKAITTMANAAFGGGKKTQWSRADLGKVIDYSKWSRAELTTSPSRLGTPHADPGFKKDNADILNQMSSMGLSQMPALKQQSVPAFPNLDGKGDIAAQHLRESQKQTGLLQKIVDNFSKAAPQLMPA
jgi:hypothetical protein